MITKQLELDLQHTFSNLSQKEQRKLENSTIVVTGSAGFLGFYFVNFFYRYRKELRIKKVICLDNYLLGEPAWQQRFSSDERFVFREFDIISDSIYDIEGVSEADYVIHMASIASPVFYRKYPLKTIDANVWGLRNLLDYYKDKDIKGLLFFSSSELYGDPLPQYVPTSEDYNGNVCATGPRACYDEAKRFGETLCRVFSLDYEMPIGVARPFNNFGPGMKINDARVPADFAKNVLQNEDIIILSNGGPSRTFCYIADAIVGYLKILLHGSYDYFNIGIDKPEVTIENLAKVYYEAGRELFSYKGKIRYSISEDKDYLTNNPQRRCPVIEKAKTILDYNPSIYVEEGVRRFLVFLKESPEENYVW